MIFKLLTPIETQDEYSPRISPTRPVTDVAPLLKAALSVVRQARGMPPETNAFTRPHLNRESTYIIIFSFITPFFDCINGNNNFLKSERI